MRKLIILALLISTPVYAEFGIVIKDHVCGEDAIIKTASNRFVAVSYYNGYKLVKGDGVRGIFSGTGTKYFYTGKGNYSMYWIDNYANTEKAAENALCHKKYPIIPL